MRKRFFGTDGIRGRIGVAPITPDFILKLGWALGQVLRQRGTDDAKVVIGKDTRLSGYLFESALEAGLSAAGVDTLLLGPMPTPAIAYLTCKLHAQTGVVISASHNSYEDNGIKFFSHEGKKFSNNLELAIEQQLQQPLQTVGPDQLGKAHRIDDAARLYIEFCKSTVAIDLNLSRLKIIIDCANGATYNIAPNIFRELRADVVEIATNPTGLNINERCGSVHPDNLRNIVLAKQADLGIAFDGDGDRVVMIDHQGELIDGDELIYIIARYCLPKTEQSQGIVGTVMSNLGMEFALRDQGFDFVRTPVGDRHVCRALEQHSWLLGGEASGHIICRHLTTTGDGIIAALQVLSAMVTTNQSLQQLRAGMKKFPQQLINISVGKQQQITQHPHVQQAVVHSEKTLAYKGRVLLRASGTEPVVRVMVEGENADQVKALAHSIADIVKQTAIKLG